MNDFLSEVIGGIVGGNHVEGSGSDALGQVTVRYGNIAGARANFIGVVHPANAEELSAVVRKARERNLALLTLYNSSDVGAGLRGDGDCLVLDLSRMNRILDVNSKYAFARIEPGVSFAQLARHLGQSNLPLMIDAERDPDASVVGSIFSKGIGFTPYADHALVQCGAEFVLRDGQLLRTGMGAMPESRTWQLYKFSLGPFSDGLAIQSPDLIPTQAGIWLMGKPPMTQAFAFDLKDDDALAQALELLRPLKLNNTLAGTISVTHKSFDAARASITSARGEWRLYGALYGIPAVVALLEPMLAAGLGAISGCRRLAPDALRSDPVWIEQLALMEGAVGSTPPRFKDSGGDTAARLTFVAPIEADAGKSMLRTARSVLKSHNLPLLTELLLSGRSLFQVLHLPYGRRDAASFRMAASCARQLITEMGGAGIGLASESVELSRLAVEALGESPLRQLQARALSATV